MVPLYIMATSVADVFLCCQVPDQGAAGYPPETRPPDVSQYEKVPVPTVRQDVRHPHRIPPPWAQTPR